MSENQAKQAGFILDGKALAAKRLPELKERAQKVEKQLGRTVTLAVVLVGEDPASQVYVGHKEKQCSKAGVQSQLVRLPAEATKEELLLKLKKLNASSEVDGILVQLPLPKQFGSFDPSDHIAPEKDVDGFTAQNMGLMLKSAAHAEACTPKGIISLLKAYDIQVEGRKAAVLGRSQIVGWPMAWMLTRENATVTVCHSRTQNLKEVLKGSDLVVVAIGRPEFLTVEDFKEGAVVIDVGIHRNKEGKLVGDVKAEGLLEKGISYSPVPGGVGPMTVSTLVENAIELAERKI